jgi:ectoine hydroxylase-related dioxygenase (phytanoyl-CoA dioxygenase family)
MQTSSGLKTALDIDGFAIVEDVLDPDEIAALIAALERPRDGDSALRLNGEMFAMRNLLEAVPEIESLALSAKLRGLVEPVLGRDFRPVRGILFDKVEGANWKVPWHQDVTIAVANRVEAEGFGRWSTKSGVLHVQPRAAVMESMVSVRLHLDVCDESNGALRVIPGSHCRGRIPEGQIEAVKAAQSEVVCAVASGGALLMRPLLLHASSPSKSPAHRRVIHLDFSSARLPGGMRWRGEVVGI